MDYVVETVTLPNGITLPYVEAGSPTGVPVICLHGITDSWRSFELVMARLPGHVRTFALSVRGHGDATRPSTGYRPKDFAVDIALFMEAKGIGKAVFVGHSMGSYIAQRFAIDRPGRVLALVLIGARTRWATNAGVIELADYVNSMTDPVDRAFVEDFQKSTLAQPVPPWFFDNAVRESLKLPAGTWKAVVNECLMQADHSARLAEIEVPTLIVDGARDTFAGDDQAALAEAIHGSRLVVYPQAGHAPHWEEPARFAADLVDFIDGLSGATAAEDRLSSVG
jgi:pimeloyl-ACP methyl ester carboxylesterase